MELEKSKKGKIIVIDGLDGSGKETQAKLLTERLRQAGKEVYRTSFPNYESESSGPVRMYLNGDIGTDAMELNPYACGLMYSVDRYITYMKEIKQHYESGETIVLDRYISANIIHQGAKIKCITEMPEYFKWAYDVEVNKMGLPMEDIVVYLTLPIEESIRLIKERDNKAGVKNDIHESNLKYLERCSRVADMACRYFNNTTGHWVKLDCFDHDNNSILSREEIADKIDTTLRKRFKEDVCKKA